MGERLTNLLSADELKISILGVSLLIFVAVLIGFICIAVYQSYIGVETTIATTSASILDSIVETIKALINGILGINIFTKGADAVQTYKTQKLNTTMMSQSVINPASNMGVGNKENNYV